MRKIQLIVLLLISAITIQSCKKDVVTSASTTSDKRLSANINGTDWVPDTINAAITYNSAAQTKTFTVVGTADEKQVSINIKLANATNTADFTIGNYKFDGTDRVKLTYSILKLVGNDYAYVQVGDVEAGSGSVTITAVDTDKKVITGYYSFTSKKVNYDLDGNIQSIEISQVLLGTFTNLPYNFVSN
jgi:hypothetical protein